MKVIESTYTGLKNITFLLYIIIVLGVWKGAPEYLHIVENIFSIVIGLALIYFFNPFVKEKTVCNNLHRKIAFSAGLAIAHLEGVHECQASSCVIDRDITK